MPGYAGGKDTSLPIWSAICGSSSEIDGLLDFRRAMELMALRSGQLLNQSEVARGARTAQPTIHRYLNLLEATHLFERLPAYAASPSTRLLKSPMAYWTHPGLAVFLSGYYDEESLRRSRQVAPTPDLIYQHLRVLAGPSTPKARLHFWRTTSGDEVDFVLEHGRRVLGVEVKMSSKPLSRRRWPEQVSEGVPHGCWWNSCTAGRRSSVWMRTSLQFPGPELTG